MYCTVYAWARLSDPGGIVEVSQQLSWQWHLTNMRLHLCGRWQEQNLLQVFRQGLYSFDIQRIMHRDTFL
jgi:hypothetical protein